MSAVRDNARSIIRIPANAAGIVMSHPEFRFQDFAGRLRGDWVERTSDHTFWFEVYNASPEDAQSFMEFAQRVTGHLLAKE